MYNKQPNILSLFACLILLLTSLQIATAQPNFDHSAGLIFEDETYDKLPMQAHFEGSKFSEMPLKVDLSPYCPIPGDQGDIQSCVGWALGYGALTIERAIAEENTDRKAITQNANSALFIYNQVKKEDCKTGSKISEAIEFIIENGDCLAKDFEGKGSDCESEPSKKHKQEALEYVIDDFMTLFKVKEDPKLKVFKVKQAIAQNKPIVVGMSIRKNLIQIKKGGRYWWPEKGNTTSAGGHAMVVVAYDETKKAFKLMNSWGTDWGSDGFIWVKYKYFGAFCKYAYRLKIKKEEKTGVKLAGNCAFKYLEESNEEEEETEEISFKVSEINYKDGIYELKNKDWKLGQLFQLWAGVDLKEEHVYAFSIDSQNKLQVHWPRQEQLNEKYENKNESALIPQAGTELIMPSKDAAFVLDEAGDNYLCVLFAQQKIDDFKTVSQQIKESQASTLYEKLKESLGKQLIPTSEIFYFDDEIKFTTNSLSGGTIVPLIIKVHCQIEETE